MNIDEAQARVQGFVDDMRAQRMHVGLGAPGVARCVTCGEAWPCDASTTERPVDRDERS